jgi:peptidoglycan/xylan/chitin deacetylase (PgdA/CDA1 family)
MCQCLSRRVLLALPVSLSLTPNDRPIEPHMRLPNAPRDRLTVALTFDACPGGFDQRIADALVAARIPATIFVTGVWLRENPKGLAFLLAHRDLFAIENHGEWHTPPILGVGRMFGIPIAGSLAAIQREVQQGAASIAAATGTTPTWYRASTGYYSPSAIPVIQQLGFGIGAYSLNADAGASLPAHSVAHRIAGAISGDVIVAHINQPSRPSGAGVAAGILELQRRSANFLRLDQLATTQLMSA